MEGAARDEAGALDCRKGQSRWSCAAGHNAVTIDDRIRPRRTRSKATSRAVQPVYCAEIGRQFASVNGDRVGSRLVGLEAGVGRLRATCGESVEIDPRRYHHDRKGEVDVDTGGKASSCRSAAERATRAPSQVGTSAAGLTLRSLGKRKDRARNGRRTRPEPDLDAAYVELSEGLFPPSPLTVGPWNPEHQHAGPPSALICRAVERAAARDGLTHLGRLTVNLLRPAPVGECRIEIGAGLCRPQRRPLFRPPDRRGQGDRALHGADAARGGARRFPTERRAIRRPSAEAGRREPGRHDGLRRQRVRLRRSGREPARGGQDSSTAPAPPGSA